MITTVITSSILLNIILISVVYSLNKEKTPKQKTKIVYKERPIEKIVYKDKIVEKIVYKEKPIEKIVYKEKPTRHEFVKKIEPKVSDKKQELLDVLNELKAKKKKSKKDQDNIYTIEKILPNIK
jgi:hypothetical protein